MAIAALVPLLISLGVTAASAVGQRAATARPRRENRERIRELEGMRDSGQWLSPTEQGLLNAQQGQLAEALAQGQRRSEQLQAAAGGTGSLGDVAAARRSAAQDAGRATLGVQRNQLAFTAGVADTRRKELAARQAKREAMQADTVSGFAQVGNAAAEALGAYLGELPAGQMQAGGGLGGARAGRPTAGGSDGFQFAQDPRSATLGSRTVPGFGTALPPTVAGSQFAADVQQLVTAGWPRQAAIDALRSRSLAGGQPILATDYYSTSAQMGQTTGLPMTGQALDLPEGWTYPGAL